MDNNSLIERTKVFVQQKLSEDKSGHSWDHVRRVWLTAKKVAVIENADVSVVELAALLHDIGDHGAAPIHAKSCAEVARTFLTDLGVGENIIARVYDCILTHPWHKDIPEPETIEAKIIADCDAMDSVGAVGICRTVQYCTVKNIPLHDPSILPNSSFQDRSTTMVNHFYEKLLRVHENMHTETCRKMTAERVTFMNTFLKQFLAEWDGEK